MEKYLGYNPKFIRNHTISLPDLSDRQKQDLVSEAISRETVLHYHNYSLQMSRSRRFPYLTASNIDGNLFKKISRPENWKIEPRIDRNSQYSLELYNAVKSDFDRGHMVKREDVQWGATLSEAREAAVSTFYYTNSVPQHASLNQVIWKSLEDYILHTEAKNNGMKISVFTGPILSDKDPEFVTPVNDIKVKIPTLFWKIVYFTKSDGQLYRVAFLMSQETLLRNNNIVESFRDFELEAQSEEDELFMQFEEAETYQVNVATIEKLSRMKFHSAVEPYRDPRPIRLVLQEIDVEESLMEAASDKALMGFSINLIS